ncbi:MAG: altronate dehydratase family protein [Pseudomonadota bacterium]
MADAPNILKLNPADDVAIATADLDPASSDTGDVPLKEPVKRGHKIALHPIRKREPVLRYGQIIGSASADIAAGTHVHSHNLAMGDHTQDYAHGAEATPLPPINELRTFMGFKRADGRAGTRNYLGILTSVNCSGSVARFIAEAAEREGLLQAYPNIDGIVPIVHGTGCGLAVENDGYQALFRTLSGYASHPNFGGILLVGLGCEVMQVPELVGRARMREDGNFRYMTIQGSGGTRATIAKGLKMLHGLAAVANDAVRIETPVSELTLALQCGGSDGYSGITANPALGAASDLLVRHGGTTILAETPEVYGAEHLLTRRAVSRQVGEKLIDRIHWWEDYTARNGGEMDNNPSPGNKRGGLTTILEKSLGAVAKGGTAPMVDVLHYAEVAVQKGFHFMDSPGYDPASVTGQIASGSNLVAFTTGRGSVSGYKPTPGMKLATNSEMYARMADDMDINCGDIITDGVSVEAKGQEIFELLIRIASGQKTKSEELGFGGAEFVPWQIGAVM